MLAEGLGQRVQPVVHVVARLPPGLDTAGQHRHVGKAAATDLVAGSMGGRVVGADHHHPHGAPG